MDSNSFDSSNMSSLKSFINDLKYLIPTFINQATLTVSILLRSKTSHYKDFAHSTTPSQSALILPSVPEGALGIPCFLQCNLALQSLCCP